MRTNLPGCQEAHLASHPTPWEDRRKGALESRVGPSKEYRKEAEGGERPEAVGINKWG